MSPLCRESVQSKGPGVTVRTESDGSHPLQIGILPKRPVLLSVHGAQEQREAIRVHRRSAQRGRLLRALPADGGSRDRPVRAATRGASGLASLSAAVVIPEGRKPLSGIVRHRNAIFFTIPARASLAGMTKNEASGVRHPWPFRRSSFASQVLRWRASMKFASPAPNCAVSPLHPPDLDTLHFAEIQCRSRG